MSIPEAIVACVGIIAWATVMGLVIWRGGIGPALHLPPPPRRGAWTWWTTKPAEPKPTTEEPRDDQ